MYHITNMSLQVLYIYICIMFYAWIIQWNIWYQVWMREETSLYLTHPSSREKMNGCFEGEDQVVLAGVVYNML